MKYENIVDALETSCPFPQLFEEQEQLPTLGTSYRRKIVHIRADCTRGKWWNTICPDHDELATMEARKEVDAVYNRLTSPGVFPDLVALTEFCVNHPEAKVNEHSPDEFNFYLDGELCCYWLRCITRAQDYNLYLHAFIKEDVAYKGYYAFLDALRDSGKTNMYGAAEFLLKEYPGLTEDCASHILQCWMDGCGKRES